MALFIELDLCFGGMNVHIQSGRINGQKQNVQGVLIPGKQSFVGIHDGAMQQRMLDEALVHE